MPETSGGAIIARMLKQEGVSKFFGIVDGSYTQLFAHCVEQGIEMITPRHEAVAAHMAGAYARLTGTLGVCIASNGPGVANMLSGVAVENGEGNRVLLITSSRRTGITYPDRGGAYQCFDHVAVIGAMSKWSQTVTSFDRIAELMRQALRSSFSGRPGVVHLDIPENLLNGTGPDSPLLAPFEYRRMEPICAPDGQVAEAARMLAEARLPMIHVGGGVIHARAFAELSEVANILHAPVTTSWSARGALAETSPLAWPMPHIDACNELRNVADLVLVLGSELGETDWWGKAPYWAPSSRQRLIQVDVGCVAARVRKLIYTSSGAAYGYYADNPGWLREDDALRGNPEFGYSDHKRLVEEMLERWRTRHPDLEQLVFRPGTILGAGTRNQITDMFDRAFVIGIRGAATPFVLVWDQDVVGAIVRGIDEGGTGIFNLAGDGTIGLEEIARMLGKPYLALPARVVELALSVLHRLGLSQYGPEQVNFLRYRPSLDNRRLKKDFGYVPRKTTREVFDLFAASRRHATAA